MWHNIVNKHKLQNLSWYHFVKEHFILFLKEVWESGHRFIQHLLNEHWITRFHFTKIPIKFVDLVSFFSFFSISACTMVWHNHSRYGLFTKWTNFQMKIAKRYHFVASYSKRSISRMAFVIQNLLHSSIQPLFVHIYYYIRHYITCAFDFSFGPVAVVGTVLLIPFNHCYCCFTAAADVVDCSKCK